MFDCSLTVALYITLIAFACKMQLIADRLHITFDIWSSVHMIDCIYLMRSLSSLSVVIKFELGVQCTCQSPLSLSLSQFNSTQQMIHINIYVLSYISFCLYRVASRNNNTSELNILLVS